MPKYFLDAARDGTVRIFFGIALGMVLAVNRGPFLGDLPGGEPQPETEKMTGDWVQLECPMRLVTVQIDRDAGDRNVRNEQRVKEDLPTGQTDNATVEEPKYSVKHGT